MPIPDIIKYAKEGDVKKVQECITNGDDINVTDHNGWTALIWASVKGNQPVMTSLIAAHADINVTDKWGRTALMWASVCGHLVVVTSLIAHQAHINVTDNWGWTALMHASESREVECVKVLIQNQANLLLEINCNTLSGVKKGSSALDIAYNKNKHNTIIELINAPDPDEINELHYYAAKENKEMIQKVITKENDVKKIKQMIEDRDRYGGKPVDINESLEEYFSQLSFNQSP